MIDSNISFGSRRYKLATKKYHPVIIRVVFLKDRVLILI